MSEIVSLRERKNWTSNKIVENSFAQRCKILRGSYHARHIHILIYHLCSSFQSQLSSNNYIKM